MGGEVGPHDYLMGLLKSCVGYEAALNANNKEFGKMIRHKKEDEME
jgi:hypothetical protein